MIDLQAKLRDDLSEAIEARCHAEQLSSELQDALRRAEERNIVLDNYCGMLRLQVEESRRGGDLVRDALLHLQSMLSIDALELIQ